MERLKVVPLMYQPGTGWHYSFATEVLARVIEVASGQSFDVCLAERVFKPLGMKDTGFYVPAEKRGRLTAVYGRGLRVVDAPQPGTTGPFTFEKTPKFLSAGRGFGLGFAVRIRKIDSAPSSIEEYEWLGGAGTEYWVSPRDELAVITLTQQMPMIELGQAIKPIVYSAIADKESANRT